MKQNKRQANRSGAGEQSIGCRQANQPDQINRKQDHAAHETRTVSCVANKSDPLFFQSANNAKSALFITIDTY
jgi:hypothetical protein